jgi:hypothetical protein
MPPPGEGLPTPRMTATIVFDQGDLAPARVVIDYQDPNARKPKEPRKRSRCTTCGKAGHNSRNPACPGRVADGSS